MDENELRERLWGTAIIGRPLIDEGFATAVRAVLLDSDSRMIGEWFLPNPPTLDVQLDDLLLVLGLDFSGRRMKKED